MNMLQYCLLLLIGLELFAISGCQNKSDHQSKSEKKSPAKVSAIPQEANLTEVELTEQAVQRLGITTAPVEKQMVGQVRSLGGEVTLPPGELAVVVAPVAGTVQLPTESTLPKPGSSVKRGRPIFRFVPLISPERLVPTPAERAQIANAKANLISLQMTADGDMQQFQEQVTAAQIALNRAEQLLSDRVGSERAVDDAKAQLALAEAGLKVAKERKQVLDRLTSDVEKESATPIDIDSPLDGIVRSLPVTLGQTVSAGTTLFEIVNLEELWIRVPVYVGLLNELKTDEPVTIKIFGDNPADTTLTATPIAAPPAADPLSSTADVYYSISNTNSRFRPGERVSVSIPTLSEAESLVIPVNALLYDMYGGTWVYTRIDEHHFRRTRVNVRRTTQDLAILESGPPVGTEVVVDGVAELFGTEFGTGK
ncbi:efflux RND transporter periplasmic adaptor subunit [Rubinisphaera italica]|nr:efflux RND transporter periplasmic adaptor subunit [Rubinisphaera italica]